MDVECNEDFGLALVYSLLSKTRVRIAAGTRKVCVKSFAKLLQAVSFGSSHRVDGDFVEFVPGSLRGGGAEVWCVDEISTYIQPILVLCPFVEEPLRIRFKGVTNDRECVDMFRIAHLAVLKRFGVDGCEIVVRKRGFAPGGKGEVVLTASGRKIKTVDLQSSEKLVKIRGLVLSSRLSAIPTREMGDVVKELLGDIGNTRVFPNISNKQDAGPSPGFQCAVFAESKNGIYYAVQGGEGTPRDTATAACKALLKSIRCGGLFDRKLLYLALSLMALSPTSIGHLQICRIDGDVQRVLNLLRTFFGFEWDVRSVDGQDVISAAGCGYTGISRVLR